MKYLYEKILKKGIIVLSVVVFFSCMLYLNGYRLSATSAISAMYNNKIYIQQTLYNEKENYSLFTLDNLNLYGDCIVKKYVFGKLFKCEDYNTYNIDTKSFMTSGIIYDTTNYYLGVKINDKQIKYISIGNSNKDVINISLNDIKKSPEIYKYKSVKNGYVVFYGTNYSKKVFTIRAFDKAGELISYKFPGDDVKENN